MEQDEAARSTSLEDGIDALLDISETLVTYLWMFSNGYESVNCSTNRTTRLSVITNDNEKTCKLMKREILASSALSPFPSDSIASCH